VAYVLGVVGTALFGAANAAGQAGASLGMVVGVLSAIAWALSTLAGPTWNQRLNLFAALFAACSLGLLAPIDKLCTNPLVSFICQ
jgi:hypothetical protein